MPSLSQMEATVARETRGADYVDTAQASRAGDTERDAICTVVTDIKALRQDSGCELVSVNEWVRTQKHSLVRDGTKQWVISVVVDVTPLDVTDFVIVK